MQKSRREPDLCWACKNRLEKGSVFCTNCNQFQNWRKRFGLGTTILALLVALVSVLSTLSTPIFEWLENRSATITALLMSRSFSSTNSSQTIWVINNTQRDVPIYLCNVVCKSATIVGGSLGSDDDFTGFGILGFSISTDHSEDEDWMLEMVVQEETALLPPGGNKVFTFASTNDGVASFEIANASSIDQEEYEKRYVLELENALEGASCRMILPTMTTDGMYREITVAPKHFYGEPSYLQERMDAMLRYLLVDEISRYHFAKRESEAE